MSFSWEMKRRIGGGTSFRTAGGLLSMIGWFGIDVSLFGRLAGHWIEQKMAMGSVWAMGITIGCQVQLLVNLRWDEATGIEKDE